MLKLSQKNRGNTSAFNSISNCGRRERNDLQQENQIYGSVKIPGPITQNQNDEYE